MYIFQRAEVARIVLPIYATTIDVTRVKLALLFSLATPAMYQSSSWAVTIGRPATGRRTTIWLTRNFFS